MSADHGRRFGQDVVGHGRLVRLGRHRLVGLFVDVDVGRQLLRRRRLGRVGRRIRVRVRRILLSDLNHPTDLHDLQCDCIDQPTHKFQLLFFLNISPVNRNRVKISRQQKNGRHSERNAKEKRKKKTHLLGGFSRLSETRAHGVDQDGDAVVLDRNWTSN